MSEQIRGALFNALGDIEGLTLLDAFTGSGALSFEAISRGASHATALDIDKAAISAVVSNASALGISDQVKAIRVGITSWLETSPKDQLFDVITADPPYEDTQLPVIVKLLTRLKPGGIFILSWPGKAKAPSFEKLELVQQNNYGDSQLLFYKTT
jgi:16S rRNA (guanine966-N2)-methyltransferase